MPIGIATVTSTETETGPTTGAGARARGRGRASTQQTYIRSASDSNTSHSARLADAACFRLHQASPAPHCCKRSQLLHLMWHCLLSLIHKALEQQCCFAAAVLTHPADGQVLQALIIALSHLTYSITIALLLCGRPRFKSQGSQGYQAGFPDL